MMITFKCKMCGGDLRPEENATTCECEYCGSMQTIPTADSEKKGNLFNRANRLRMAAEYDKAATVYASITAEFPEEAEAYWGLCLCKYGIEYVEDSATAKKIPTCHRTRPESILDDPDFDLACEYADAVAKRVYREEAKAIDRLQRDILSVVASESPYDVFICYKETGDDGQRTEDSVLAQDIYDALTAKGLKVFFARITLEDKLGRQYEPYIYAALHSARVMLAVGTQYEYFDAAWVKNEWARFLDMMKEDRSKALIPCYKGIDAYDMPREFKNLQAQDMGKLGWLQDLTRGVMKLCGEVELTPPVVLATQQTVPSGGPTAKNLLERGFICLEDGLWEKARLLFDEALNINPKCGEAYVGLIMEEGKFSNREAYAQAYIDGKTNSGHNLKRAQQFADGELAEWLEQLEVRRKQEEQRRNAEKEARAQKGERLRRMREQIQREEEQKRREEEQKRREKQQAQEKENRRKQEEHISEMAIRRAYIARSRGIIGAGKHFTLGLKVDGSVVATGKNDYGQCNVAAWRDIIAVCAGDDHAIGLKYDGTVVATGNNSSGQCDTAAWTDIIAISAGLDYTVGLKADGTVVAVGNKKYRQCDVDKWTDIVAISAHGLHTVGLKSDGTVVGCGGGNFGQYDFRKWSGIIAIGTGAGCTTGLKADGTVVHLGNAKIWGLDDWKDIIAVDFGDGFVMGLKFDGTVVSAGDSSYGALKEWSDIVSISGGSTHAVGLKSDGTVVAIDRFTNIDWQKNVDGESNVGEWKLFDNLDTLEKERIAALIGERTRLESELASLKGLFTGKRRRQIENRLAQIESRLKNER